MSLCATCKYHKLKLGCWGSESMVQSRYSRWTCQTATARSIGTTLIRVRSAPVLEPLLLALLPPALGALVRALVPARFSHARVIVPYGFENGCASFLGFVPFDKRRGSHLKDAPAAVFELSCS